MTNRTSPYRISITGIDGVGKDSIIQTALTQLSVEQGLTAMKLGRPSYKVVDGQTSQVYREITEPIDRLHRQVDRRNDPDGVVGVGFLHFLTQTRLLEADILDSPHPPDLLVSARDPRVDWATYFSYYAPKLVERTTPLERFDIMQALTGGERDLVIQLLVEPTTAVARIEQRIREQEAVKAATGALAATVRDKWRHPHEDELNLAMLAEAYEPVLDALHARRPHTTIIKIDTNGRSAQVVAEIVAATIVDARAGVVAPGERLCR